MSNGTGADGFITELRGSNDKSFSTVFECECQSRCVTALLFNSQFKDVEQK